jgi:hypothetical protein
VRQSKCTCRRSERRDLEEEKETNGQMKKGEDELKGVSSPERKIIFVIIYLTGGSILGNGSESNC